MLQYIGTDPRISADPDLIEWFIGQAGSNDPAFITRSVLHMCTHDFTKRELSAITAPTLIVTAGKVATPNVASKI